MKLFNWFYRWAYDYNLFVPDVVTHAEEEDQTVLLKHQKQATWLYVFFLFSKFQLTQYLIIYYLLSFALHTLLYNCDKARIGNHYYHKDYTGNFQRISFKISLFFLMSMFNNNSTLQNFS